VHRLDKHTSGLLLFAKNLDAQRHLSHQFQNNLVQKEYLALIYGRPSTNEGEIEAALDRHPSSPQRMTVVRHGGLRAKTLWKLEESYRGYSLLRVFPKTGKTHQIRVHLKHAGLPLAIDPLYNPPPPDKPTGLFLSSFKRGYKQTSGETERPLIDRLTLHAERLKFLLPDGSTIELSAPLPKDFRATLNQLRRHGSR
jgi:23S rRNA pseudouridine955/2504/2580 synthase/23S rRNA pseudouridine1911/1915/1917 synthase